MAEMSTPARPRRRLWISSGPVAGDCATPAPVVESAACALAEKAAPRLSMPMLRRKRRRSVFVGAPVNGGEGWKSISHSDRLKGPDSRREYSDQASRGIGDKCYRANLEWMADAGGAPRPILPAAAASAQFTRQGLSTTLMQSSSFFLN